MLDSWGAKNESGEYIQYYNHTGSIIVFTRDDREAYTTNDPSEAQEWCRVAREVYGRSKWNTEFRICIVK